MKIVIPGGSGQVGTMIARRFIATGHQVVVLSRQPRPAPWRVVAWDGHSLGDWAQEFEAADVVINLAGRSVNCRYHEENRRQIMDSRVLSTRVIGQAISQAKTPPRLWLQSSTATIYAHRYDAPQDEATGVLGGEEANAPDTWKFSIEVAKAWEQAALEASLPHTRLVLLRLAMTMSPDPGGVFDTLLGLARWGLGGTIGDGRQYMSWIHEEDYLRSLEFLIEREDLAGTINVSSPNPLPQAEFMTALREAWGIGFGLPAYEWMLEVGTYFMGSESELVLKSRRVVPQRLLDAGLELRYPHWPDAAQDLCRQWREQRMRTRVAA